MATVYWYDEVDYSWTTTEGWSISDASNTPWLKEESNDGWDAPYNY